MKVGDRVRILRAPDLPDDLAAQIVAPELTLDRLYALCVGKIFQIADIAEIGWVELEVGALLGENPAMRSIWIEPAYLEPAERR